MTGARRKDEGEKEEWKEEERVRRDGVMRRKKGTVKDDERRCNERATKSPTHVDSKAVPLSLRELVSDLSVNKLFGLL